MKKLASLALAVVSTMFLFVGASQAAEKLDTAKSPNPADAVMDGPSMPCVVIDN